MITIIDYDMGNSRSIVNMLNRIGVSSEITRDHSKINASQKIILPGVGSFDAAMKNLKKYNLIDILNQKVLSDRTPVLGICLGMQLLTNSSEEGNIDGLGWIKGRSIKFDASKNIKVPHMGWNLVIPKSNSKLCKGITSDSRFYFVHSYYVKVQDEVESCMQTNYSLLFDSALEKENIFGVQFHPEKSHKYGMQLLKNFSEI